MRFQGKISNWNDEKGFGFVEPHGGGERAFVHVKAFNPRTRRPVNDEIITYELVCEKNNQYRAENIRFSRDSIANRKIKEERSGFDFGSVFTLLFCVGLLVSVFFWKFALVVGGFYCLISFITFLAYAIDKSAAINGRWRTQENTLHLLSILGGWPGAYFSQIFLRHKSIKKEFKRIYWITVFVNLSGFYWLHTKNGTDFLTSLVAIL